MLSEFSLFILYSQVLVHLTNHPSPGLIWSDEHVAQGFAWSKGLVAFGIPDHDGECLVRVIQAEDMALAGDSLWAVQVPFEVTEQLQIGTVALIQPVEVPVGKYALLFEARPGDDAFTFIFNLRFVPSEAPEFIILKQGGELETNQVLRRDASLAG